MRWTIRRKLILSISVPLLITYLLILVWDYHRQRENAVQFMQDMVLTRARLTAGVINARMEQAEQLARSTANLLSTRSGGLESTGRFAPVASGWQNDWVSELVVVMDRPLLAPAIAARRTGNGFVIRRMGRSGRIGELPQGLDLRSSNQAWITNAMDQGKEGWSGPATMAGLWRGEAWVFSVPVKTLDDNHGVAAVAVPTFFLRRATNPLSRMLEESEDPGSATRPTTRPQDAASLLSGQVSDFVILDAQGGFVYHPSNRGLANEPLTAAKAVPESMAAGFQKALGGEGNVVRAERLGIAIPGYKADEDYWVAFVPIPATGWVFATAVSETESMRPILALMGQRAGLLLAGLVVMLLCVYLMSVRFSVPIERMARAVQKLGEGDLQTQVPERGSGDEVAQLSRGFNAMVGRIRQQMEHIRQAAIDREKVEGELRIARRIQADLLPQTFPPFPHRKEFELHAANLPAAHVAGDFYDFFFIDDRRLMLVIADVAGKGVPAAILMAVTRTIIRNLAMTGKTPLEIVKHTNQALVDDSPAEMFVTMIVAEYDTHSGELRYVNAGHCPPMVIRANGRIQAVDCSTCPLVGATNEWPDEMFGEARLTLEEGEVLVLYTDGVTEARNAAGGMLHEQGLMEMLRKQSGTGAEAICKGVVAATDVYQAHQLADDLTLVVLRRVE